MSKLSKLRKTPGLFFADSWAARILLGRGNTPAVKKKVSAKPQTPPKASTAVTNELPSWYNPRPGPELSEALAAQEPLFLYLPWIELQTDALISSIPSCPEYRIAGLDLFQNLDTHNTRREISRFARENPAIYRRMLARRLVPLRNRISGIIFTFDWASVARIAANLCEELSIPRILIPHESVFADRDKYYRDSISGANLPIADIVMGWGEMQRNIFTERGYPDARFISTGAPKFDGCKDYTPNLTRAEHHRLFGLDPERETILFCAQPLDSQFSTQQARESQRAIIGDLLDVCEERGAQLIVRMPPSKDAILNKALRDRIEPSSFAAIDEATCYLVPPKEAIYHSDLVTSVNSTMLFEAWLMGRRALSTKYVKFEQIWQKVGIPAATKREALFKGVIALLDDADWEPDTQGMEWAGRMFGVGAFDGNAGARISMLLSDIATGRFALTMRPDSAVRALETRMEEGTVGICGLPAADWVAEGPQKHLLSLVGAKELVQTIKNKTQPEKIPAIDIFLQWGITPNDNKKYQKHLARVLGRPTLILEDGFIRSLDIGLSGTPALSLILDDKTAYYDATRPSRLTLLLDDGPALTEPEHVRARAAMDKIVAARVSKYNHAPDVPLTLGDAARPKILLVDQRYGDQSVASGLADEHSFKAMLADALTYKDHDIIIKQHPDATKGGKESYFDSRATAFAKHNNRVFIVDYDVNPYALFDVVEKVFVVTSGMGFEALMARREVHCYGAPFYAGWGVTHDTIQIPHRSRARTLEDIFHFAYISLSRYYRPDWEKRCEVEDLVDYIRSRI